MANLAFISLISDMNVHKVVAPKRRCHFGSDVLARKRPKAADQLLVPELVAGGDYTTAGGRAACGQILENGQPFTALFCASDIMAYGAMEELAACGLGVPQDFAIIGFDDMEMSSLPGGSLSSISFRPASPAGKAIDRLIHKIDADGTEEQGVNGVEPCALIIRSRTAGLEWQVIRHEDRRPPFSHLGFGPSVLPLINDTAFNWRFWRHWTYPLDLPDGRQSCRHP